MQLGQQNIFKKVPVSEKKFLFRELAHDKIQVAVKGDDDSFFNLIAVQTDKDEVLLCHHTSNSKLFEKPQSVVVNFLFKSERYFFRTDITFSTGWAHIRIDGDLFQLQRRANARIELPTKYDGVFNLMQHGSQKFFIDCKILDVSAGGLRIAMATDIPALKTDDIIRGTMRLGVRRPIEFELEVRFSDNKNGIQVAGLQFRNVDNRMESRLLSLMVDLQREIFVKYPTQK
ncbi:PilZ domain-containing protein [Bdellovibrio sp. HCB209]|uniref:PilZ domain-containing protein n=1 Tax=Bdellovibrio sp. HCB209 TaxID=3394354 RepID=UPI0039B5F679